MKRPDEVNLSREDDEALIERLEGDALTTADRRVLVQVLRWYFLAAVHVSSSDPRWKEAPTT